MGLGTSCLKGDRSLKETVASRARLEALANLESTMTAELDQLTAPDSATTESPAIELCRLAYSSVLVAANTAEAQKLLAVIFTQALTKNPPRQIGGILFYDEKTSVVVQVLEGPAATVRGLYHDHIKRDKRHAELKLLWDQAASTRQYEGFGMQLGSDPTAVLQDSADLVQLTYSSDPEPRVQCPNPRASVQAVPASAHHRGELAAVRAWRRSQLTATSHEAAYEHMQSILAAAFVNNPRLGIGGALFFNPRTFQVASPCACMRVVQTLEGRACMHMYAHVDVHPHVYGTCMACPCRWCRPSRGRRRM